MVSELECIHACIVNQGPFVSGLNYALISIIALTGIVLVFFHKRLAVKWNLFLKAVFLTAIFSFLVILFFAQSEGFTVFKAAHTTILFLIIVFFATSYILTPFIAQFGLKRHFNAEIENALADEAEKLGVKKPRLYIFEDMNKTAFVVSGLRKTIFLSTGILSRLNSEEIRVVLVHELLHLKSGFFKTKRFLQSIKAGFFGLLPIQLEELDTIEELRVDNKLLQQGLDIKRIKQKL